MRRRHIWELGNTSNADIYFRRDYNNEILRAGFKSSDVLVETFRNSQMIIEEAARIAFLQVAISGPQKELDNLR